MARPLIFILILAIASAQRPPRDPTADEDKSGTGRLKRSQIDEILKSDRTKSIEDAAQMVKLSEELRDELEKNDKTVLSVAALKKAEEIEKLAKRIRGRLKRY